MQDNGQQLARILQNNQHEQCDLLDTACLFLQYRCQEISPSCRSMEIDCQHITQHLYPSFIYFLHSKPDNKYSYKPCLVNECQRTKNDKSQLLSSAGNHILK